MALPIPLAMSETKGALLIQTLHKLQNGVCVRDIKLLDDFILCKVKSCFNVQSLFFPVRKEIGQQ